MEEVLNKIFFKIEKLDDEIKFYCNDGYFIYHATSPRLFESVSIDDTVGDLTI
jgi:hypothetical protein